jgi:hypothetical protein
VGGDENRGVCGEKGQISGENIKNSGENKLHHAAVTVWPSHCGREALAAPVMSAKVAVVAAQPVRLNSKPRWQQWLCILHDHD